VFSKQADARVSTRKVLEVLGRAARNPRTRYSAGLLQDFN